MPVGVHRRHAVSYTHLDEQYGEEIMAVVILKEGETSSEEEIKDYVRTHMAKHKVPRLSLIHI